MSKVIIIINAQVNGNGLISTSPVTEKMVKALKNAIFHHSQQLQEVEVIAAASLWSKCIADSLPDDSIYCPLTIQLPKVCNFPQQKVYHTCENVNLVRDWVESKFGYLTSKGNNGLGYLWLPIILTAKGPFYGEVISETEIPNSYSQPLDFPDYQRQGLYHLAYQLLEFLQAPPSVYLLQFALKDQEIVFDRLWPFPAAPALASVGRQHPDLFSCYWLCLKNQPIKEVAIFGRHK